MAHARGRPSEDGVTTDSPRVERWAGRRGAWAAWVGSVLLHALLFGSMYAGPSAVRRPADADSSPLGGDEPRASKMERARRGPPALETIPIDVQPEPRSAELPTEVDRPVAKPAVTPDEATAAEPQPKPEPVRPALEPARATAPRPVTQPSDLRSAARTTSRKTPDPAPDEKKETETPYTEGEDWLGIEDELSGRARAEDVPSAAPVAAPTASADPDPLLERLLAAEARKAKQKPQRQPDRRPERRARPEPALPETPSPVGGVLAGVSDVPVGLARCLSWYAGAEWDEIRIGRSQAELNVRLRDARVVGFDVAGRPAVELQTALRAASHCLRQRDLPGGTVHARTGELRLRVNAQVSRTRQRETDLKHYTTPDGRYLPSARVLRPSARRIELNVELLP